MKRDTSGRGIVRSYRLYSFLIFFVFVLAALILVGSLSYRQNRVFFQEFVGETNRSYVIETGRLIDRLLYQVSYTSAAVSDRASVLSYVGGSTGSVADAEQDVLSLLSFLVSSSQIVTSAAVYSGPRNRIVSHLVGADLARTLDSDWIKDLVALRKNVAALLSRNIEEFGTPLLSILRRIDVGSELAGGVIINIPIEGLRRALGYTRRHPNDDFVILDPDGMVLFSFQDAQMGATFEPATDSPFVQSVDAELFNLTYVSVRDASAFDERLAELRRYLVVLVIVVSTSGAAIAAVLAGFAYRPIQEIVDTIENPDRTRRTTPGDDIRFIEDTIVQFMASNSELERRLSDRFENLRRANYVALQLQMNPHFLSNTLDSLYWTCLDTFPEDSPVPQSLASLSRLLRMLLDTDEMAISLEDEMRLTDQYLRLLQTRFRGAISVRWDVPDGLRSHLVPKLLIQPLVENAYYHGIKPTRRPGTISIRAARGKAGIAVSVADDGRGMDAHRLEVVRASVGGDVTLSGRTIGIHNVAHRLRIMFGDEAGVTIESRLGYGTTVAVLVPDSAPILVTG